MIDFKFNEIKDIKEFVDTDGPCSLSMHKAIWYSAIYFSKINPCDKGDIFDNIVRLVQKKYSEFKYEGFVNVIKRCIKKASDYSPKDIEYIPITKSEIDKIFSLNDIKKEKIAFVILAIAKYFNAASNSNKNCLYAKTSDIFKYARVSIPSNERDLYLHFAHEEGILNDNFSIGYDARTVAFVSCDENDDIVLKLDENDFKELAYAYLNYKNGGYKRCKECGRWFKIEVGKPNAQYCHLHQKVKPNSVKILNCIDCGKSFEISSRNNTKCRCDECQEAVNKVLKSERNKKYYEIHRNSDDMI